MHLKEYRFPIRAGRVSCSIQAPAELLGVIPDRQATMAAILFRVDPGTPDLVRRTFEVVSSHQDVGPSWQYLGTLESPPPMGPAALFHVFEVPS